MEKDICPSRDDAQPHIFDGARCSLCLAPLPALRVHTDSELRALMGITPTPFPHWNTIEPEEH